MAGELGVGGVPLQDLTGTELAPAPEGGTGGEDSAVQLQKGENTRDDTDGTESIWGQQEEKHKSVWMDVCGAMRPQVVTEEEVTEQLSGAKMRTLQKNSGKLEVWGTCKFQ